MVPVSPHVTKTVQDDVRNARRFGRLTVIGIGRKLPGSTWLHWCRCDCGTVVEVRRTNLVTGNTRSCGCFNSECSRGRKLRHGKTYTRTYRIWCNMVNRCTNPNNPSYPDYAGRGITVDPAWRNFDNFQADMGDAPDGLSLGRIDNDGPYCKSNCRWETPVQQGCNKRNNRLLSFRGVTQPLSQWARDTGINEKLLHGRLRRLGWSVEDALTTPLDLSCQRRRSPIK
jgi:hypothetical protein